MDILEEKFIRLAFIESKTYAEIESLLGINRKVVGELWNKLKNERETINKIKTLYRRKGYTTIPFTMFYERYSKNVLQCCYCRITQEQIDQLFQQDCINTKRRSTRGRSLELERILPNESYENLDNLKLACYWCNNAKSDEFSEEEFKLIGLEIGKILKARIKVSPGL